MKYFVVFCFILSIGIHVEAKPQSKTKDVLKADSLARADSLLKASAEDSVNFQARIDSLKKAYSIILFNLRSQQELYEYTLIQSRRTIAFLVVISLVLIVILIIIISRKSFFKSFPHFRQKKKYQPGIVCLQMMYKYYYHKKISYKSIIKNSAFVDSPNELNIEELSVLADNLGFDLKVVKADLGEIYRELDLPVLLYMPNHMAVLFEIKNNLFYLSDPYYGYLKLNLYYFATSWFIDQKNLKGVAIQLYPLKKVKASMNRRLNLEKFSHLRQMERKTWKNYGCELEISESD